MIVRALSGVTAFAMTYFFAAVTLGAETEAPMRVNAVRTMSNMKVDGILSEPVWHQQGFTNFTERDPNEGSVPSQRTEVWVAYDDENLYVAARMYDTSPDSIVARLARRDMDVSADKFTVYLDPYHDKRSGYYFGVNAAGTIYDGTLYNDDWNDNSWDGVWEAKTHIDSLGWTAELRIPLSQLRFQKTDSMVWGIDFERFIGRNNEDDFAVYTPKNSSGFVSRFMQLTGIEGVEASRPLEVLPYLIAKAEYPNVGQGDPFNDGSKYTPGFGGDFKIGIGNNLTLDGTVNPDFGQVEVDPAVVNLSDVETYYNEKRPFFIEGADIFNNFGYSGANNYWSFNFSNPSFFYSRRIGRPPQGSLPTADFVDEPSGTQIIGAAKLTGKVGDGWTAGAINALTANETARVDNAGTVSSVPVEPLTYYGVARVRRELDGGMQGIGLITTLSERDFESSILRDQLNSSSLAIGVDGWTFLDHDKEWVITGWTGFSQVRGDSARMLTLQQDPIHYFQRPDAHYVHIDSTAASLTGYAGRFALNKQKGNFYLNAAFGFLDPRFDVNDLGFMWRDDMINGHVVVGYQWTEPGAFARQAGLYLAIFRTYDFGGSLTWSGYFLSNYITFPNYYKLSWFFAYNPQSYNDFETRGGPQMLNLPGWETDVQLQSDDRREWMLSAEVHSLSYLTGDRDLNLMPGVTWKPGSNLSLTFQPSYDWTTSGAQWVGIFADRYAVATYGNRYVFGTMPQTTISATMRVDWAFTPQLTFQVYLQPLISAGKYTDLRELARPGSYDFNVYGQGGSTISKQNGVYSVDPDGPGPAPVFTFSDPNFNIKSLRGDAVLRWEFMPGSTAYFVWTQNRMNTDYPGMMQFTRDITSLLSTKGDNVFVIKISYWFNP